MTFTEARKIVLANSTAQSLPFTAIVLLSRRRHSRMRLKVPRGGLPEGTRVYKDAEKKYIQVILPHLQMISK